MCVVCICRALHLSSLPCVYHLCLAHSHHAWTGRGWLTRPEASRHAREDGTDLGARKLTALRKNSNFFRKEMKRIGMHVYGDFDSPIIPVMLYYPAKVTPHHHLANYTNLLSRHRSLSLYRPLTRMLTPLLSFAPHFYATVPHRLLHSVANASRGIWQW